MRIVDVLNKAEFRPEMQKGWFFFEWEHKEDLTIDLSLSFYHKIHITDDINIYFKNAKEGYLYVILLEMEKGKTITWKNGNNIYIRFAEGVRYENCSVAETDSAYLGAVVTKKDEVNLYLDFIAIANNFEEIP